jgi:acetyl/propionyl-CoA carboxylase alpha subunit
MTSGSGNGSETRPGSTRSGRAIGAENELRAPIAGTVREVRTVEGASVEAQTVLVVIG